MRRATIKDISEMSGVSKSTIRRMINRGLIETNRDYNGWRVFPNPEKTVEMIKTLMIGEKEE